MSRTFPARAAPSAPGRSRRRRLTDTTLLVTTNDFAVASVTNSNLPYDPIKNFSPITIVAASPQVVAANPSFPAKTMKELIDVIKAAPDKYSYASLGIGFGQLSAERLFKLGLKLDKLVRVPFNGAAPAVNSTLAGDTQVIFLGLPPVAPHLQSDKLRAIAVTSQTRSGAISQRSDLDARPACPTRNRNCRSGSSLRPERPRPSSQSCSTRSARSSNCPT